MGLLLKVSKRRKRQADSELLVRHKVHILFSFILVGVTFNFYVFLNILNEKYFLKLFIYA